MSNSIPESPARLSSPGQHVVSHRQPEAIEEQKSALYFTDSWNLHFSSPPVNKISPWKGASLLSGSSDFLKYGKIAKEGSRGI